MRRWAWSIRSNAPEVRVEDPHPFGPRPWTVGRSPRSRPGSRGPAGTRRLRLEPGLPLRLQRVDDPALQAAIGITGMPRGRCLPLLFGMNTRLTGRARPVVWMDLTASRSRPAGSSDPPSIPAVSRPALRCVTCRALPACSPVLAASASAGCGPVGVPRLRRREDPLPQPPYLRPRPTASQWRPSSGDRPPVRSRRGPPARQLRHVRRHRAQRPLRFRSRRQPVCTGSPDPRQHPCQPPDAALRRARGYPAGCPRTSQEKTNSIHGIPGAFRRAGFGFLGRPVPARLWTALTNVLPTPTYLRPSRRWTCTGLPRSACARCDRSGCPLCPEAMKERGLAPRDPPRG